MKKVISILLTLVMLISTVPFAYASQNLDYQYLDTICYTNDVYNGITETHISNTTNQFSDEPESSEIIYKFSTYETFIGTPISNVGEAVRDNFIERNKDFTVEFVSSESNAYQLARDIVNLAISEELANVPEAGDYIKFHLSNYSISISYSTLDNGLTAYQFNFNVVYFSSNYDEYLVTQEIDKIINEYSLSELNEYEKIKTIYHIVNYTTDYDYENLNNVQNTIKYSTYGAVVNKIAVCQGFATFFYRLCKELEINCRVITSANHAWNIVEYNGRYFNIDTTYADSAYNLGDIYYEFFMKCNNDFEYYDGHIRESAYTTTEFNTQYPMAQTCLIECSYGEAFQTYDCNIYGHSYAIVTIKPTCTSEGYDERYCEYCGYSDIVNYVDKSSHTYDTTTVLPTCTKNGYDILTCSICGYSCKSNIVKATGHLEQTYINQASFDNEGSLVTRCVECGITTETSVIPKLMDAQLLSETYTYNGKVQKPTVRITDETCRVIDSSNYTVSYSSGCKNAGTYKVIIKFKGNYSGTKTLYFTIKPKVISIDKLIAGDNRFTIRWNKQFAQCSGYQIQYSTSSNFKPSTTKTSTVSNYKTTSKTIKSLKNKKKYYVRIRTYKVVNGTKYYSNWSAIRTITTK